MPEYNKCIASLGFPDIKCNTNHLWEDLRGLIPDIKSVKMNYDWSLVFDDDLSTAVVDMKTTHLLMSPSSSGKSISP